ncbi:LOW QUALITY PROTEIN: hypothetical protein QTO34_007174 [Cnephaeus nilssonii]|uniref:Uncharacterized protein n=1 Tax=Cnephaeus nilssonii TaxID=3371016 RepID=A0AA40HJT7_CNENI|nr:LOW QUALITY PROTEIN: hypothetical protein QTO34_007174 [Eptesicus nilssonii]
MEKGAEPGRLRPCEARSSLSWGFAWEGPEDWAHSSCSAPLCHFYIELGYRLDLFANLEQYTQWINDNFKNTSNALRKGVTELSAGNLAHSTQKLPGNRIRELIEMAGQKAQMCHHMAGESRTDCSAILQKLKHLKYQQTSIHGIFQDIQVMRERREVRIVE